MEKKTALYDCHLKSGGRMVPFAGYLLPIQYPTGILTEHMAVRDAAGLFDVSHMGEFLLSGKDALFNLQRICTADFATMPIGKIRYTLLLYPDGGVVDDLLVYRMDESAYFLVVNAACTDKDYAYIRENLEGEVEFLNVSDTFSQIAVQGPLSEQLLAYFFDTLPTKYYTHLNAPFAGEELLISRTGYTGEDGFEIYLSHDLAPVLWEKLLQVGKGLGVIPCGLGARDTLRLEAAMPLYGHEISPKIDPITAGLNFAVKFEKGAFIGSEALSKTPHEKTRVGLRVLTRGIVREGAPLLNDAKEEIGFVTSGTFCPYLNGAYAMAIVPRAYAEAGTQLYATVRGSELLCEVVPLPFYKKSV